jgi:hypothetical protein
MRTDFSKFANTGASYSDFLDEAPSKNRGVPGKKIAGLGDLDGFLRVADDTLVHKATKDFWSLVQDENGKMYIQRLVDANGIVED